MLKVIKAGSRPSRLAIEQVKEIQSLLPEVRLKQVSIDTTGDLDKNTPLFLREGSDFFTREIENALIIGKIDAAIHSAKDLEVNPPKELVTAAITKSISIYDCLVSRGNLPLDKLPGGSIVGTSSFSRKQAIIGYRSDLKPKDIRGNIDERLKQLEEGNYDAVIIAHAALLRLGYQDKIAQVIPTNIIKPNPLQGCLAIQVLRTRRDLLELFGRLHAN
ncbi:MAG: hydroxymethylbilane synthase [Candidatus Omnitrophota bacterium]|jgi:hydroxymethylbilane synthase|nr:MAG: hydroxymethylbilane synthase [Candidatus Omnitrophota bacterium]